MHIYLLIFLNLLSNPNDETVCSCRQPEPISMEEIEDYDIILRGFVQKIETVNHQKLITFKIKKLYKGKLEPKTLTISTPAELSMCGLNIGPDREWLLFAFVRNGEYSTNSCTRSGDLDSYIDWVKERVEKDIAFLDQLERK